MAAFAYRCINCTWVRGGDYEEFAKVQDDEYALVLRTHASEADSSKREGD